MVKNICYYKPSITRKKKYFRKRAIGEGDRKDMERKYASAGPNKQMYEIYNLSMR